MPRRPRVLQTNGIYHIFSRGNNKKQIFSDFHDYNYFLTILGRSKSRMAFKLFGYVLMVNHFHLLIKTSKQESLPRIMQSLLTSYAHFYNRKHGKVGHLFQDRYKSMLVTEDEYLIQLLLYIHDNPFRAGLVENSKDYPHSSLKYYLRKDNSLVDTSYFGDRLLSFSQLDYLLKRTSP